VLTYIFENCVCSRNLQSRDIGRFLCEKSGIIYRAVLRVACMLILYKLAAATANRLKHALQYRPPPSFRHSSTGLSLHSDTTESALLQYRPLPSFRYSSTDLRLHSDTLLPAFAFIRTLQYRAQLLVKHCSAGFALGLHSNTPIPASAFTQTI
jgi:hypothetical protein